MAFFPRRRGAGEEAGSIPRARLVPGVEALVAAPLLYLDRGRGGGVAAVDGEGAAILLDSAEASLLQGLKLPCGPEELRERLSERGWGPENLSGAAGILAGLEERGLLRRLGALVEAARAEAASAPLGAREGLSLGLLAIPTKDRPETLAKALAAWDSAFGAVEGGALPDIVIADDSLREAAAVTSLASSFATGRKGATFLLGGGFRRLLSEALSPAGGRAAAFALGLEGGPEGPSRYGAARNLLLLASAGRAVAMADDDMLPDLRLHPGALHGLALSSASDPTVARPFPDRRALEAWLLPPAGPAGYPHARLLGTPLRELLLEAEELDLGRADAALLESGLGGSARVAALCYGTWGDSGMPSNRYLLALRGLVDRGGEEVYGEGSYEAAMGWRTIFRSPLRDTIGGRTFMGGHIALDARSLLPPFSPWGRDEDGLWGFSLGILHPGLAVAYPALALLHEPPGARASTRDEAFRGELCLNETLRALLGILASRHEGGASAYGSLGGRLARVAGGPKREFRRALAESSARSIAARMGLLEGALEEYGGEPAAWAADVEAAISALEALLEEPRFWLPRELRGLEPATAEEALADYLLRFGELLQAWPAIFEAAARIGPELLEGARVGR